MFRYARTAKFRHSSSSAKARPRFAETVPPSTAPALEISKFGQRRIEREHLREPHDSRVCLRSPRRAEELPIPIEVVEDGTDKLTPLHDLARSDHCKAQ
ncbi:MAG: hypothetical protein JNM17_22125 [Archangium sp.]|nr:hypothetical protein [Archangium sp.]